MTITRAARWLLLAALLLFGVPVAWSQGQTWGQPSGSRVTDTASLPFGGAVALTSGVSAATYGRSVAFVCSSAGTATFAFQDGSTMTLTLAASAYYQSLPFAITMVTAGTAVCVFWNMK